MNWLKRGSRPGRQAAAEEQPSLAAVRTATTEAAARGWEELERLVEVLADVEETGGEDLGRAALGVLSELPRVVARLDEHARRALWYPSYQPPVLARLVARVDAGAAGPIAVALATTHRDGRIREKAVAALLARPCPELMPFLVLRTGDWVAPVRDRARAGLAVLLANDSGSYLPAVLPTTLVVAGHRRGGFAHAQMLAALITAPTPVRQLLAASADRGQRRFVFDTALAHGWLGLDELVAAAETDGDVRIRVRAAEAACREAVWTRRVPTLRRLVRSRRGEVRVVALTGLVRSGHDAEVLEHLDDDAALVRAVARDAARRVGVDPLVHYRTAVAAPVPAPGAIAGLAEAGSATDAALLQPLLAHVSAGVRAQAVRALHHLGGVDVDALIPLLRDPSPAVVRETTAAVRPRIRRVPPGLAWQLLTDSRAEVRRAGYRLLRDRTTAVHLRAALTLAADRDPALARRGCADVTRLARDAVRTSWRRTPAPELLITVAERADLTELTKRAAGALGEDTAELTLRWLAATTPTDVAVS
ncbi:hypothetical protein ACNTMW_14100 [Planosporangium sp. 12N6]|uniref:hypothetical protein n=1 Tax=Planosporangium spinosum TaxID=3402278 RepID=UPI003CFB6897